MTVEEVAQDDQAIWEFNKAIAIEKATLPLAFVNHGPQITLRKLLFELVVFGRPQHLNASFCYSTIFTKELDAVAVLFTSIPATIVEASRIFVEIVTLAILQSFTQLTRILNMLQIHLFNPRKNALITLNFELFENSLVKFWNWIVTTGPNIRHFFKNRDNNVKIMRFKLQIAFFLFKLSLVIISLCYVAVLVPLLFFLGRFMVF